MKRRTETSLTVWTKILVLFIAISPFFPSILTGAEKLEQNWKNLPERVKVTDYFSFIYQQDPLSEITVIHILVKGGKRSVPLSRRGVALLATRLAVEMPDDEKLRDLMHLGSTMMYQIEGDFSTITINTLSENLEKTLQTISSVIRNPLYSGLRINNIKRYMEHQEKQRGDSSDSILTQTCIDVFFSDSEYGYGGSVFGTKESREAIKIKDVQDFFDRFFNHENMVVVVTTNLDKNKVAEILKPHFESFPATPPQTPPPLPKVTGKIPVKKQVVLEKEKEQVLIAFSVMLPGSSHKNFAMGYMLENFLGKGIGSKLWSLREKQELAYSLKTEFTQMKDAGLLTIYMKTDPGKKDEAYQELKKILMDVYNTGATAEEFSATQEWSRADFYRDNETKIRRAQSLAYFEAMGLTYNYLDAFFTSVEEVTVDEFNRYIKEVLNPGHMIEVMIGPGPGNPPLPGEQ